MKGLGTKWRGTATVAFLFLLLQKQSSADPALQTHLTDRNWVRKHDAHATHERGKASSVRRSMLQLPETQENLEDEGVADEELFPLEEEEEELGAELPDTVEDLALESSQDDDEDSSHSIVTDVQTLGDEMEDEGMDESDITQPKPSELLISGDLTDAQNKQNKAKLVPRGTTDSVRAKEELPQDRPAKTSVAEAGELQDVPDDVMDALQRGVQAHDGFELPTQLKNTTIKKTSPITEQSSQATEEEEDTLQALTDLQKPMGEASLDSNLEAEKALEKARLEALAKEQQDKTPSLASKTTVNTGEQLQKDIELDSEEDTPESFVEDGLGSVLEEEAALQEESSLQQRQTDAIDASLSHDVDAGGMKASSSNSSLVTQGVIIGSTISGIVKDNSTGIAGVLAVLLAISAGAGLACIVIAAYKRLRSQKEGKSLPRIIEIGSLAQRSKSPAYSRVGAHNQDSEGTSGARWQDFDDWDGQPQRSSSVGGPSAVKQKKAWDWDADW